MIKNLIKNILDKRPQGFVKSGFTLAEVLITLGIIGVVAALTIPALMQKTQDAEYKSAYKKAFSEASQAVLAGKDDFINIADDTVAQTKHKPRCF